MQPVELLLTCGSELEARTIADNLLLKKLIACAEIVPVSSQFQWKGKIDQNEEFKLSMLSQAKHFDAAEAVIKTFHSYETYVLKMSNITKLSSDAVTWLSESTD
jgi:uncharacterized protein involved in tolerance to divalent cations